MRSSTLPPVSTYAPARRKSRFVSDFANMLPWGELVVFGLILVALGFF